MCCVLWASVCVGVCMFVGACVWGGVGVCGRLWVDDVLLESGKVGRVVSAFSLVLALLSLDLFLARLGKADDG